MLLLLHCVNTERLLLTFGDNGDILGDMSVTFTKLFSSITASTVWVEDSDTRVVWITLLAMADKKGRVWGSVPNHGIASIAKGSP